MKTLITMLLFISISIVTQSQDWRTNLPKEKVENGTLTFYDYQKAFYGYWEKYDMKNGYYYENNERKKVPGYKQFKRWEYHWKHKVDSKTGKFPSKTATDVIANAALRKEMSGKSAGDWENIGIISDDVGRLNCVAFHPTNNDVIYVGAPAGGLWKTDNAGDSWEYLMNDLDAVGVSSIVVISTGGDDILYIGTGDRDNWDTFSVGVLKSIDGGNTWNTTGLSFNINEFQMVTGLVKHPTNDDILYATTSEGLYITENGGDVWSLTPTQSINENLIDIELHPDNPDIIYISTRNNSDMNTFIYQSIDGGDTWGIIFFETGLRTEIAVSPDQPDILYAVVADIDRSCVGVYKREDSGSSFDMVLDGKETNVLGRKADGSDIDKGQGEYDLAITVDPNDANIIYVGGINTWHSVNGGENWLLANYSSSDYGFERVHADKHFLAFQPGSHVLFECNDGGIYKRSSAGTWESISKGLIISQIYRLGLSHWNHTDVLTGLQDNGTQRRITDNNDWEKVSGGDGMECIINYLCPIIQYASVQNGKIYRTTNNWYNKTNITKNLLDHFDNGAWLTPYVMDNYNPAILYLGMKNVWKTTNSGSFWSKIGDFETLFSSIDEIDALAVAPSNSDYIYAGTFNDLFMTNDGGGTWMSCTSFTGSSITYITVKDNDPETVWVTCGGFSSSSGVYESPDGGSSWTKISDGLPEQPVYCVIQNTKSNWIQELYAGTEDGVYCKIGTDDWALYGNNLPNVEIRELEFHYGEEYITLKAATYGRGIWLSIIDESHFTIWTGTESHDWFNKNNWKSGSVPTFEDDVLIPSPPDGYDFYPIIENLTIGSDCRILTIDTSARLQVTNNLVIEEGRWLKCRNNSIFEVGGNWTNLNDAGHVNLGYGFRYENGSKVVFNYQVQSVLSTLNISEKFYHLEIDKGGTSVKFRPQKSIIVEGNCKVNCGIWEDYGSFTHKVNGNFVVMDDGTFKMQPGGSLDFTGIESQRLIVTNSSKPHRIRNVRVNKNSGSVSQLCNLAFGAVIRENLYIDNGSYEIGYYKTVVLDQVRVKDFLKLGSMAILAVGNLIQVEEGGTFFSEGKPGYMAKVTSLPSANYGFNVEGTISSEYTYFKNIGTEGLHVKKNGIVNHSSVPTTPKAFYNCSFSSSCPGSSLLTLNNSQDIILGEIILNYDSFILTQNTITKTEKEGSVCVTDYSPLSASKHELDPNSLINWTGCSKSGVLGQTETSENVIESIPDPKIYPNPCKQYFTVEIDETYGNEAAMRMFDYTGKQVHSAILDKNKNTIQTDNLSNGIYLIQIETSNKYYKNKIIIQ